MRLSRIAGLLGALLLSSSGPLGAAVENANDSAAGLPANLAKNYLVAKSTMSPDKRFAAIYPTLDFSESKEAKDMLVALKPFKVLATLPTDYPYHQSKSNSGISAQWSKDSGVALITIESKWGPGDLFVVELSGAEVKRTTNVLEKLTQVLLPKFRAATPKKEAYNDFVQFVYEPPDETKPCTLAGNKTVKIDLRATNDPKGLSENPWSVRVKAEWDIVAAKFSSQKITNDRGQ
jgi:hypothetical protein